MPFWKVYHPVGGFTAEDKKTLAKRVTELYANAPLPRRPHNVIAAELETRGI